jgi:hypothetical protein
MTAPEAAPPTAVAISPISLRRALYVAGGVLFGIPMWVWGFGGFAAMMLAGAARS